MKEAWSGEATKRASKADGQHKGDCPQEKFKKNW